MYQIYEKRVNLTIHLLRTGILNESLIQIDWDHYSNSVATIHRYLEGTDGELTGWLHSPLEENDELLNSIEQMAYEIKMNADVLVVIGVGGSFLGARAIIEALTPYFGPHRDGIEVVYVGQNMSGAYINQLLNSLKEKEVYVNVISKSGTTMEPALAFRVLRQYMEKRYGDEAQKRIIVTTDADNGTLKKIADSSCYRQFIIPSNIGGRYSVLTPVGLLPIAVAGVDIHQLLEGAKQAATHLKEERLELNEAYRYAVMRHALYQKGFQIELLASFEPCLAKFHEWWKQLFGESEGKGHERIISCSSYFSTDLTFHWSVYTRWKRFLFETLLHFQKRFRRL